MGLNGSNLQTIKQVNRGMVLRLILLDIQTNRSDISRALGLTKTTITNIVAELIQDGIVQEIQDPRGSGNALGRKSIGLDLSDQSPLIFGVTLQRQKIMAVLSDLKGNAIRILRHSYEGIITVEKLCGVIRGMYAELSASTQRKIFAVGVSSAGPVDVQKGLILKPQRFYEENQDFAVVDFLKELTGVPVFLAHDVSAAVVAEKLYGNARKEENFMYVSTINGLGVGFFLKSRLFDGESGQSGELGHISIDYRGEPCECGRRGCVERYIDFSFLRERVKQYEHLFPGHPIFVKKDLTFFDVVLLAEDGDMLASIFLDEYCQYLSSALSMLVLSLGVHHIYISNILEAKNRVLENILERKLNEASYISRYHHISVDTSGFGLEASLYGAMAIIMDKVFAGKLYFC